VISFGEIAAGTGSFIRYAKALGMECRWLSEVDTGLHAAASNEAGPTRLARELKLSVTFSSCTQVICRQWICKTISSY
jgi:hypothetical protein